MAHRLAISPHKVVHETVEGETIVIHLKTGSYYSLTGAAAEIWSLLEASCSGDQIAAELAERHGRARSEATAAVSDLLGRLAEEDLVEPRVNGVEPGGRLEVPAWRAQAWAEPKFEKFDDMQDFLLVDPIHEVDETGWPSPKPG